MAEAQVSHDKKLAARNLYASDISEEFIAMQFDLDIPTVVSILKEMGAYDFKKKSMCWPSP